MEIKEAVFLVTEGSDFHLVLEMEVRVVNIVAEVKFKGWFNLEDVMVLLPKFWIPTAHLVKVVR